MVKRTSHKKKKAKFLGEYLTKETLFKVYKLSSSVNVFKPIEIIRVYFMCIKEDYIQFKKKIKQINNIDYNESKKLFKSYISKQLYEIGKYVYFQNKEYKPNINQKGDTKKLLELFQNQRKKYRDSQIYCPFCAKSLYYLTRHFFDIRTKNSQGCQIFYNILLSIQSFDQQVHLYYDIFKYIYPSLNSLRYETFYNIIKNNIFGKEIPKEPIYNIRKAYEFTSFLHKLLRNFQLGLKKNKKNKIRKTLNFSLINKKYDNEIMDFNNNEEVLYIEEFNQNTNGIKKIKEKKKYFSFKKDNYSFKNDS